MSGRLSQLLLVLAWLPLSAVVGQERPAYVSIIIDDLGNQWRSGQRVLELPGEVSLAILPHTPYSVRLATRAHEIGREVLLHLPMASIHHRRPGPGAVNVNMPREEFLNQVEVDLAAVPYISGVNNHMGSQVTPSTRHMEWLMEDLRAHGGLFFVDSMTTATSVAAAMARETGLPTVKRDVFLDNDRDPVQIHIQLERLVRLSRQRGWAVAIGHPYPETLALLEAELPKLEAMGIKLVPVSQLIRQLKQQGPILWQASLSPSPQDSKN